MSNSGKICSIIIPAYNEELNIRDLLERLTNDYISDNSSNDLSQLKYEIILVCNGCRDNTYQIAKEFEPQVTVLNLKEGSKTNALNAGDKVSNYYPKIYLDADISFSPQDIEHLVNYMNETGLLASGAAIKYLVDESSWLVKCFYKIWIKKPYLANDHNIGSGIYAVSSKGRNRFDAFPNIIADDYFINNLFLNHEKKKAPNVYAIAKAPKTVFSLIKIKSRSYYGNKQLDKIMDRTNHNIQGISLIHSTPKPHHPIIPHLIYIMIQISARLHAIFIQPYSKNRWQRDETNR